MAANFTTLRNEALKLLNETNTSVVGELATGLGSAATVSSDSTILDYINEAAKEMCRSCVLLESTVTPTGSTARLTTLADQVVWFPLVVSRSGVTLTHCGEQELRVYDLSYTSVTGTPTNWYRSGEWNVGLYPVPTVSAQLTITGASIPEAISTGSGEFTFAPDDILLKAIPSYVAAKLALKNFDDPSLIGRAFWKDWYDTVRMNLWLQLDLSLRMPGGPFATPPVMATGK